MKLPAETKGHYTVWVSQTGHHVGTARYAVDGESLVVFGDDGDLRDLREGDRVFATINELHSGPPLVTFPVTVHELRPDEVSLGVFADVVGHRRLATSYEAARESRRLLALQA
jgi:hypothetical protein